MTERKFIRVRADEVTLGDRFRTADIDGSVYTVTSIPVHGYQVSMGISWSRMDGATLGDGQWSDYRVASDRVLYREITYTTPPNPLSPSEKLKIAVTALRKLNDNETAALALREID